MENYQKILLKYNWPTRTQAPKRTMAEIEGVIRFKLPNDYKTFLQTFSGGEELIGPEFVRLWDNDELIEANIESGLLEALPQTIGIGGNGAGEIIAIENLPDGDYKVVLTPFIFEKKAHIVIGSSFTDFLTRLDSGQAWFG